MMVLYLNSNLLMNITTLTNKSSSARFFVLLTVASLVMTAFPVAFFVTEAAPAASVETIFFDGFESGDFTSWDADESPWAVDPAVGYGSPTSATISNTGGAKEIRKAISTVGFDDVSLKFAYRVNDLTDPSDDVRVEYSTDAGTTWNRGTNYDHDSGDDSPVSWRYSTLLLHSGTPNVDNNPDFQIRFLVDLGTASDKFDLDAVEVSGTPMPASPTLDTVAPDVGTIELATGENFVWTVDANDVDGDLYRLEIDHSYESVLPEFSVYASTGNPYGSPEAEAAFAEMGAVVTYDADDQKWTIDFGLTATEIFIAGEGVTFYAVLKDENEETADFGSMSPTAPENTFVYSLSRAAASAPTLDAVSPTPDAIELATGENFVWTVDANDVDGDLASLEIDHSLGAYSGTPEEDQLPEFTVYADPENVYGSPEAEAAFASFGVTVSYDDELEKWTIDFGDNITDRFVDEEGITFYVVLKDVDGNKFGSMSPTTEDNTFVYGLSRAEASAPVEEVEEPSGRSGGSSSGTRVRDRVEPTPLVLGVSDSQELTAEELSAFLTSISAILAGIQSGSEAGDISDEEVAVLSAQLGKILTVLLGMFR
jgi:hypothetical protein